MFDEAEAVFRRAIDLDPYAADPHRGLGRAFEGLGRFEEAENCFRRAGQIELEVPLREVRFTGASAFSDGELRAKMNSVTGYGTFDDFKLGGDLTAIRLLYREKGYLNARVDYVERVDVDGGEIDLHIKITAGVMFAVEKVSVAGNRAMAVETVGAVAFDERGRAGLLGQVGGEG